MTVFIYLTFEHGILEHQHSHWIRGIWGGLYMYEYNYAMFIVYPDTADIWNIKILS